MVDALFPSMMIHGDSLGGVADAGFRSRSKTGVQDKTRVRMSEAMFYNFEQIISENIG